MTPQARQILLDMKAHLSIGWVQNLLFDTAEEGEETTCLLGAGVRVAGLEGRVVMGTDSAAYSGRKGPIGVPVTQYYPDNNPYLVEAFDLLADDLGITRIELAIWNDAPGRTHAEIIDLIDRVLTKHPEIAPKVRPRNRLRKGSNELLRLR